MKWKNINWIIGRPGALVHPYDGCNCWSGEDSVTIEDNEVILDIIRNPRHFDELESLTPDNTWRTYSVGYLSSTDTFKYGSYEFEYVLPKGIHLWPALWLTGVGSWPPEIDVMEAWSGNGFLIKGRPNYCRFPFFNNIVPGVFYGTEKDKMHNTIKATCFSLQKKDDLNTCKLIWEPNRIVVFYNNKEVYSTKDPDILKWFNDPNIPMRLQLNTYITPEFTENDYDYYVEHGRPFIITDLSIS